MTKQHRNSYDLTRFDLFKIKVYRKLAEFFEGKQAETANKQSGYYSHVICPKCGGKLVHDYFFHAQCRDCEYKYDYGSEEGEKPADTRSKEEDKDGLMVAGLS